MTATEYIPDFANRLSLSPETVLKAHSILEKNDSWNTGDVEPRAVAAAALHVAGGYTGEERTPSEVIAATGISAIDLESNLGVFKGSMGVGVDVGVDNDDTL